ncbi:hypothetical protein J5Y03_05420 [Bacillus sp. RG28]|uniref:Uncharacterized protein n=1 Tax=Gottfriedia endophytica TaxID=2820819 RepID=A0A940SI48_9BACI|nr:hypothetical protein [Gottfriedia endophytica]MBP0724625.1 hypothetical protein [Gottfriedia endophytica]
MKKLLIMISISLSFILFFTQFPNPIKAGYFTPDNNSVNSKNLKVNINFDSGDSYVEVHVYTKDGNRIMVPVKINNPFGTGAGTMKLVFKTRYCGEYQFPTFKPDGTSMASGTYINFECVNYSASKPITDPSKLIENFKTYKNIDFRKYEGEWSTYPEHEPLVTDMTGNNIILDFKDKTHANVQIVNRKYHNIDGSDLQLSKSSIGNVVFDESGKATFIFNDSFSGGKGVAIITLSNNSVKLNISFPITYKENTKNLKANFINGIMPVKWSSSPKFY